MFARFQHLFSPHADEDVSIAENEEENVLLRDVVKVGALLVGEEQVGFPQTLEHLRIDGERIGLEVRRQLQPGVVPSLPQEDVDPVILHSRQADVLQVFKTLYRQDPFSTSSTSGE